MANKKGFNNSNIHKIDTKKKAIINILIIALEINYWLIYLILKAFSCG